MPSDASCRKLARLCSVWLTFVFVRINITVHYHHVKEDSQVPWPLPMLFISDAVASYKLLGNHLAQNLVRSFSDAHQHCIAVVALDFVFD